MELFHFESCLYIGEIGSFTLYKVPSVLPVYCISPFHLCEIYIFPFTPIHFFIPDNLLTGEGLLILCLNKLEFFNTIFQVRFYSTYTLYITFSSFNPKGHECSKRVYSSPCESSNSCKSTCQG